MQEQLDDFEVDADSVTKGTWTELSGVTGTRNGQKGSVTNDAGTHTDPVTGATVSNRGTYSWSVSPAGWKWVGADDYGSIIGLGSEIGLSDSYSIAVMNWDSSILTDGFGNTIGLSFAVGQNGVDGSNIANILISDTYVAPMKGAGSKVRTAFYLDISASFARVTTPFMFVTRNGAQVTLTLAGSVSDATQFRVVNNVLIGQRRFYELEWMLDGTETGLSAQVRFTGSDAVAPETVQFSGVIATTISTAGSSDFSIFDLALAAANKTTRKLAVAEAIAKILGTIPYITTTLGAVLGYGGFFELEEVRAAARYRNVGQPTIAIQDPLLFRVAAELDVGAAARRRDIERHEIGRTEGAPAFGEGGAIDDVLDVVSTGNALDPLGLHFPCCLKAAVERGRDGIDALAEVLKRRKAVLLDGVSKGALCIVEIGNGGSALGNPFPKVIPSVAEGANGLVGTGTRPERGERRDGLVSQAFELRPHFLELASGEDAARLAALRDLVGAVELVHVGLQLRRGVPPQGSGATDDVVLLFEQLVRLLGTAFRGHEVLDQCSTASSQGNRAQ